ncbi:hypothetical protein Q427_30180 [Halomonas sp. BC04]|nr:hypothetical protein Q427_30180 [Halomonas sp. BC04]
MPGGLFQVLMSRRQGIRGWAFILTLLAGLLLVLSGPLSAQSLPLGGLGAGEEGTAHDPRRSSSRWTR